MPDLSVSVAEVLVSLDDDTYAAFATVNGFGRAHGQTDPAGVARALDIDVPTARRRIEAGTGVLWSHPGVRGASLDAVIGAWYGILRADPAQLDRHRRALHGYS
jgi:hypothetical protein